MHRREVGVSLCVLTFFARNRYLMLSNNPYVELSVTGNAGSKVVHRTKVCGLLSSGADVAERIVLLLLLLLLLF